MLTSCIDSCRHILEKNMYYQGGVPLYLLYDMDSPLASTLASAWINILTEYQDQGYQVKIQEFINPPQPLYRGGLVNPDNPYQKEQKRVITEHNIQENNRIGLDHQESVVSVQPESERVDLQTEKILSELQSLPADSIVILVQSTNFRLSTFRIRLELFHRGVHVVEFNHLAYIKESEFPTFFSAIEYRTPEYVNHQNAFNQLLSNASSVEIVSMDESVLRFGAVERIRGNTGDYTDVVNKGGTFPLGEVFTEAKDLESVSGSCLIDTFPNEDFSISVVDPFRLTIEKGRVLPSDDFPLGFKRLYDLITEFEGEVRIRELGFGLNPAISSATPLSDINFHERKLGVHFSLGKKHGIYGKKLPKTELQRFHIDVFASLLDVRIDEKSIYDANTNRWTV